MTGATSCDPQFCNTALSTEYVNDACGWHFSRAAMINHGGKLMARETASPHKTFLMDWLYGSVKHT